MENIKVNQIYMDGGKLSNYRWGRLMVADRSDPVFSWSVRSALPNNRQSACRVRVYTSDCNLYWDSGWVETENQRMVYAGKPFPQGQKMWITVCVRDVYGNQSIEHLEWADSFVYGMTDMSCASWITHPVAQKRVPICFRKDFELAEQPVHACLYVAGIGYHNVTVNG